MNNNRNLLGSLLSAGLGLVVPFGFAEAEVEPRIETYAGGGPNNMWALNANFVPEGLAMDGRGNLFIASPGRHRVFRVDAATHTLTTVAGNGLGGFSGDGGPATDAKLAHPRGVAVDAKGNVFIADFDNQRIRRVDAVTRVITTWAGNGTRDSSGDGGLATAAGVPYPSSVAIDAQGNVLIAEYFSHRVRRVDAASPHAIITWAGNGSNSVSGDGGPATAAGLRAPYGLAVDAQGNVFIADRGGSNIRRVDAAPPHVITTWAGNGTAGVSGDGGPATAASLYAPSDIAVDSHGTLFIADGSTGRVRRVDAAAPHIISTWAGNGTEGFGGDGGPARDASFHRPSGVAVDASGNVYISDTSNYRVRRVDAVSPHIITTVAGNGTVAFSGDCGPSQDASIGYPAGVAVDTQGNLFIADHNNYRVRRVDAASPHIITTVAGNGTLGFSGDGGPARAASLSAPQDVAVDAAGNVFIATALISGGERVRRVDAVTGMISTWAGTGTAGFSGDGGPATDAELMRPTDLAVDAQGNVFIAEYRRVRRVGAAPPHIITTWAGTGTAGFSGDGGPATQAKIGYYPKIALDAHGNLFIADPDNYRVRRVDALPPHIITTWAGTGTAGSSGDGGPAKDATMHPTGVAVDAQGNLFILETGAHRIRRVDAAPPHIITAVAGAGAMGFDGDGGPAAQARLSFPVDITVDVKGNLFIADQVNDRVRRVYTVGADLIVASVTHLPAEPTTQSQIASSAVIRNIGTQPAPASTLSFRVGGERPPGRTYAVPTLAPGESFTASRQDLLTVTQNYRSTVVADINNDVSETDETNNQGVDNFTVAAAVCNDGTERSFDCTVGGRPGTRHDVCVGGVWRTGTCVAMPECVIGEERLVSCRLDGAWGTQREVCLVRRWRKVGACQRNPP